MAVGIGFASVCVRKLERLKMLLAEQRAAFEADVAVEETHFGFLETVLQRLAAANAVKDTSIRKSRLSSKRVSQNLSQKVAASIYRHVKQDVSMQAKDGRLANKTQNTSIGAISMTSNRRPGKESSQGDIKGKSGRPSVLHKLYGVTGTKPRPAVKTAGDDSACNIQFEKLEISPFENFQLSSKNVQSPKIHLDLDSSGTRFFSSIKKSGLKHGRKSRVDEGNKSNLNTTVSKPVPVDGKTQRPFSKQSNPSWNSLNFIEHSREDKTPTSQTVPVEAAESSNVARVADLNRLVSPKATPQSVAKKSTRLFKAALAGLLNKA